MNLAGQGPSLAVGIALSRLFYPSPEGIKSTERKHMSKGFDIAAFDQHETTTIDILHPVTGDPIPGVIATVYGQDSAPFKEATRKYKAKYTAFAMKNRGKVTPEYEEQLELEKVTACTKSIDGLSEGANPLTNVADILARPTLKFIYEQITAGIMDRAGFIKGSSAK